jgi:two-component system nitrogen regulation response regulator GlnG
MTPGEQVFPKDLPIGFASSAAMDSGQQQWQDVLRQWTRRALDAGQPELMNRVREDLESVLFDVALEHTGGKRVEAARLLGVGRNTLTRKLKERET